MAHTIYNHEQDQNLLERVLIEKAKEHLRKEVLASLKEEIEQIAVEAVTTWAEVRLKLQPMDIHTIDTNIHVQFVEKITRTLIEENPIKITVTPKQGNNT